MHTTVRNLNEVLLQGESMPESTWQLRVVQSGECMSYVAWNEKTREALVVDPKLEDTAAYLSIANDLKGYLWVAVIDTHTHADHISSAAKVAETLKAPLVMHANSPSKRVSLRVSKGTVLPTHAGPIRFVVTPGHTQDSITVLWGPYVFGGDTILYGDVGRDDLPGGSAEDHYQSIQALKSEVSPEMIVLPGHDHKGGRASSWGAQLKLNSSLTQNHEDYVRESEAFDGASPALLKKSLAENFK